MEDHVILVFFFFVSHLLVSATDTFSAVKDGDTIVSNGQMFELGFFSPKNTTNRYLGIWYNKIANGTVVWVANRETPLTDTSGVFKVGSNGSLLILNANNTEIWSSISSNLSVTQNVKNPELQLLDNGNLVVWDDKNMIWQSFDYPGNTFLPGMKFGKDMITGIDRYFTSWKTPDDPSQGTYVNSVDTTGYPQIFVREGSVSNLRIGPWNGLRFHGRPVDDQNLIFRKEFILSKKEIYLKYELKTSVVVRIVLRSDGSVVPLQWMERTQDWKTMCGDLGIDSCGKYGFCGPYGVCSINKFPLCSCLKGFVPTVQEEWNAGDWSKGCKLKQPLTCPNGDRDSFKRFSGLKFPDTRSSLYNMSMTLAECEISCRKKCSCTAYANLDVRKGGSGCLLWFGELIDIREYDEDQNIYIRMADSEFSGNRKKRVLTVILAISLAALLLSAVAYSFTKKKKRSHLKGNGNSDVRIEDVDELPFFSLNEIVKATKNFSIDNKIGEGGFGPVYKGVLEDGREVAVKRLSDTSKQGLEEFKNEVICIAKLQHRNLVKLLGYCIHRNEMILIYEYMANKSLDLFIFDDVKSSMLDWPQLLRIIHGMARGILYLHQDSRFQIIHRDLKAGNILLDDEMNPKISDFGLARKFVGFDNAAKTKKVVGTYGYISPEYAVHGRFSTKSDVFSFGVLLLEIVSGMKNREFSHKDHMDNLLGHAWRLYKEGKSIELMSASLRSSCIISEVERSIHVGLLCVQHHAEDRPTMMSVILMLVGDGVLPQPKQPAFSCEESRCELKALPSVNDYMITFLSARS